MTLGHATIIISGADRAEVCPAPNDVQLEFYGGGRALALFVMFCASPAVALAVADAFNAAMAAHREMIAPDAEGAE